MKKRLLMYVVVSENGANRKKNMPPNRRSTLRFTSEDLYSNRYTTPSIFFPRQEVLDVIVYVVPERRYGFWSFVGDCFMTIITYGFWLIWIFIREMRNRRRYSERGYISSC